MRHLLALAMSFLLAAGGLAVLAPAGLAYTPDNEELTFLALINDYRGQQGLAPLSLHPALGDAAKFHSQDMAENNYFEHTAPNGTNFDQNITNFGYTGTTRGENIAAGTETAAGALVMWQNSPEHNAGMLNPAFNEIGIGRFYNANSAYGWYWTTTFGGGSAPGGATERANDGARDDGPRRDRTNNGATDTVVADPNVSISDPTDGSQNVEDGDGQAIETQQEIPGVTNADGANVSATDDGSGPVNGDGAVNVYDDINTGGVTGDNVNYDQSTSTTPASSETAAPPAETTAAPADTAAPPAEQPAPVEQTTVTATDSNGTVTDTFSSNIQEADGDAQSLGNPSNTNSSSAPGTVSTDPIDPAVASEPAPVADPAVDPALAGAGCANYATWYDAQVAYESAGATAADPALVNSLDPNWDGVACEELMT
ncbi:MAG: CAP domain-containing protein, partial [Chloroflexota bacterium]|nr:CAP domain-containing protein [Chloroflexota bacterium]